MVESQRPRDPRQVYLDLLQRQFRPEDFAEALQRLEALEELGSAVDFRRWLREDVGSPERMRKRQQQIDEMLENQRFFRRVWASAKAIAISAATLSAGFAALRYFAEQLFGGTK